MPTTVTVIYADLVEWICAKATVTVNNFVWGNSTQHLCCGLSGEPDKNIIKKNSQARFGEGIVGRLSAMVG